MKIRDEKNGLIRTDESSLLENLFEGSSTTIHSPKFNNSFLSKSSSQSSSSSSSDDSDSEKEDDEKAVSQHGNESVNSNDSDEDDAQALENIMVNFVFDLKSYFRINKKIFSIIFLGSTKFSINTQLRHCFKSYSCS